MENLDKEKTLNKCWDELYPDYSKDILNDFIDELKIFKIKYDTKPQEAEWYKDAVVYSLYVDLFNKDFPGLERRLDYLKSLGVNCLWLLPILDSPMRDSGFDIRHYDRIRKDLLGLDENASDEEQQEVFRHFLNEAHKRKIRIIFDIAINHTSEEHEWFQQSRKSPDNPYRDYYIWNKDDKKYKETRLLFKGMCPSNWQKDGNYYFFHRFFEFQPDLNYHNPKVLLSMSRNLLFWLSQGVDGFRADAIPYLWKEEGTDCENLPKTHTIVKFYRAVLDYVRPNTLLLAEACQPPKEVVKYFGNDDECNAGYNFPLMPQIFKALGKQKREPIIETLNPDTTPDIPKSCQWFIFLRCHDELSLESVYVSEKDREYIYSYYCREPRWDFRLGEGISARLSDLLEYNQYKIGLAYSIMLTLPGTPVVYYGDEFGKTNDEEYYKQMKKETGKNDTRYFVRGKINWAKLNTDLRNKKTLSSKVFNIINKQLNTRRKYKCFGRGSIEWLDIKNNDDNIISEVLAYIRSYSKEKICLIHNLTNKVQIIKSPLPSLLEKKQDLLKQPILFDKNSESLILPPFSYYWILLNN